MGEETVWLSQEQMALLFGKGRSTITEHIRNIFAEGELQKEVVCRKFRHTTQHGAIAGKIQDVTTTLYNLDVIISVGYRVKSAAELIFRRVDASLPLLGMQSFDKKNDATIRKSDVSVAKNYLKEEEM